jgi:nudix-type nucleoside diphosphatase (YffH/AdpP family)
MKTQTAVLRQVNIISEETIFKKHFFVIREAKFRHTLYNGQWSEVLTRLNFERGDSAAVIMHDPVNDTIILTEQFRYPTHQKNPPGWILEIPAGTVESDEAHDPTKTMRREILEEIGYNLTNLQKISSFYVSPGGTSERIHLYYAKVSPKDKVSAGGGILSEGEDIRVLSVKLDKAIQLVAEAKLMDAKTIIGIQWLQLNRANLK